MLNKLIIIIAFSLVLSCRTTDSGTPQDSSLQAWSTSQALSVAKINFRHLIVTCVPKMADYIQAGRGEKVKKFIEVTKVDKFLDYILTRATAQNEDLNTILRTYYEGGQKSLDDCMGPVAEYVVLEFVSQTGLLRYGFGTKGEILPEPQAL